MHKIGGNVVAEYPNPPDKNKEEADVPFSALLWLSTAYSLIEVMMVAKGRIRPAIAHAMWMYLNRPEALND